MAAIYFLITTTKQQKTEKQPYFLMGKRLEQTLNKRKYKYS